MICIIQARMSSRRLPNKVLKKIYNITMLERVVNKLKKSKKISRIIIATSTLRSDDKIEKFCKKKSLECFRGSINNVYYRFVKIVEHFKDKSFIRITGDSPLIDYRLVDKAIRIFNKNKPDIVTNTFPRSYHQGQSVEIINCSVFLKFFKKIKKRIYKEHVTKYFYENFQKFKIINFSLKTNFNYLNLSINTKEDFNFVRKIIYKSKNKDIGIEKLLMISEQLRNEKKI